MARLVSASIQNLLNGISQQPDTVRLPNQANIQENGLSDVVFGLGKRPPTEHIAKLSTATDVAVKTHLINASDIEEYQILITNGGIKAYTLAGVEKTVVAPSGLTYLATATPQTDINCITVADFTFIINKTKTVTKSGSASASRPDEAIFFVKNGQYKTTYKITIDGSEVASFETLDNSSSGNASSITTDNIASELTSDLNSNLSGFTVVRDGSIIYVKKNSGTFTAGVSDGLGGDGLILLKDKTQSFSDLPYVGYTGFQIEITGDSGTQFDNYFVKWDGSAWVETVKDGLDNNISATTMPFVLIRTADGNFRFTPCDGGTYTISGVSYDDPSWKPRECGDSETNPVPSFIGTKVNDIFFYRNRLGFCSDENVIFSKAGEFFNFYYSTVTTTQDDDVVDISMSHNKVSILKYAVPFNEELILFSDQSQFILKPEETLTAKTVSINQATEYEISDKAKPIGLGQNIYFASNRGSFSGVSEYYVSSDGDVKDATDTTINLPRYIKANIYSLKGSSGEKTLFALSDGDRSKIFVYKYYFDVNQKALQRSWSTYSFASTDVILGIDIIQNMAYLIIKRADGTYVERMNLKANEVDTDLSFPVLLDRKATVTGSYSSSTNLTTWTIPYPETNPMEVVYNGAWGTNKKGRNLVITQTSSTTITSLGDHSAHPVFVGRKYNFKYQFSKFYPRETKAAGGGATISAGRLQLKRIALIYGDSGYFEVTVTPKARTAGVYKFTGQILGSSSFTLGSPFPASGDFKVPIQCRNQDVTVDIDNDSYLPSNFLSAEWTGIFSILSTRNIS